MPLLANMNYVDTALSVAYRGSEQPQRLSIDMTTTGRATMPLFGVFLAGMQRAILYGGAAGARFRPWEAVCDVLTQPEGDAESGPSYHADLMVAGMAPEFLRVAIEYMRGAGADQLVTSLTIQGELPLEASDASVTQEQVKTWLDSPTAYPGYYPQEDFPVEVHDSLKGGSASILLANTPNADQTGLLRATLLLWHTWTSHLVGRDGRQLTKPIPVSNLKLALSKREFVARMAQFPWTVEPARASLRNYLAYLHHRVAAIAKVEIAL